MSNSIKLSIQQIVFDFESLIRAQEKVNTLKMTGSLYESDCIEYKNSMVDMAERYLPNYMQHIHSRFFSDETDELEKAGILATVLYENFKEIFYQLI